MSNAWWLEPWPGLVARMTPGKRMLKCRMSTGTLARLHVAHAHALHAYTPLTLTTPHAHTARAVVAHAHTTHVHLANGSALPANVTHVPIQSIHTHHMPI